VNVVGGAERIADCGFWTSIMVERGTGRGEKGRQRWKVVNK
jgi:hypothetical protein